MARQEASRHSRDSSASGMHDIPQAHLLTDPAADLCEFQRQGIAQAVGILVHVAVHQQRIEHPQDRAGRHAASGRHILQAHGLPLMRHDLDDLEHLFH